MRLSRLCRHKGRLERDYRFQQRHFVKISVAGQWIEARARWSQLRQLGNSNLVRASVLMPAFGYMLLLNENVHQYLTIKYDGWLLTELHLPNVWRIWLLFYGSFCLAAATILYSLFCPVEVKRYVSSFEMADEETSHQLNLGQFDSVKANLRNHYTVLSSWEKTIVPPRPKELNDVQGPFPNNRSILSVVLIHQWTLRNLQRPRLRCFVFLLYAVGLALVGIPAAFTFVQVSWLGVRRLAF